MESERLFELPITPAITPSVVAEIAAKYRIPPDVLIGCIGTESSFDAKQTTRYEPKYEKWLRTRLKLTDEEYRKRSTSWGIGHVMGQTLREIGCELPFETFLTDHRTAVDWAARYLKQCWLRASKLPMWRPELDEKNRKSIAENKRAICLPNGAADYWEAAIGAYNTGGFTTFPEKHIARFRGWRKKAAQFGFGPLA